MAFPRAQFSTFLAYRKEFIEIGDTEIYKRARVQLHWKGVLLRDQLEGALIKTKAQQIAHEGDLLVAEIDAKVGGVGIVPRELDGAIVSSHYFLFEIDESKCLRSWLDWFVRADGLRDQFTARGSTNYAAIRPHHVLNCEIPLPPLEEQRRIVARIEELAARVHQARQLRAESNSETEAFLMKVLAETFGKLMEDVTSIGAAFRVTTGGTPSRHVPQYWGGDVKWVSSGEVAFCKITDTREKITEQGMANSNAKIYPPNTVLLAMIGQGKTRGQCAILNCNASTNQNVAAIHVHETQHNPEFVYWWLLSRYQASRFTETGTAQPALSGERVKQMPIPLPSFGTQAEVVRQLNTLDGKTDCLRKLQITTTTEMDALLPSILSKAFRGEL
jgi:type I restriction enzyme S subunit